MKIQQLNNIRRKSLITIYASLKKEKTLFNRYGKEFNIFNFLNNTGSLEVLFYPSDTTPKVASAMLNQKLVRLKLKVKPAKYTHPTKYNSYILIGVK